MARHPYSFRNFVSTEEGIVPAIYGLKGPDVELLGMTDQMLSFFKKNSVCFHCREPVESFEAHRKCIKKSKTGGLGWGFVDLLVSAEHGKKIRRICTSLQVRPTKLERERRLRESEQGHTKKQVEELFQIQEGRCYYCYKSLTSPIGKNVFHRDHFNPVIRGGNDSIANIVLACPGCNIEKGAELGESFKHKKLESLPATDSAELKRIHHAVANRKF